MLSGGTLSHSMYGSFELGSNLISASIRETMPKAGAEECTSCGAAPIVSLEAGHARLGNAVVVNTWHAKRTWSR
eukprot:1795230-Amphidinium_carterae.1